MVAPVLIFAQNPPHPNSGGAPGAGNTVVGGAPSAPIGGGTEILIAFGIAYAIRRWYLSRSESTITE